jgi:PAS domain S-box-containing protein
MDGPRPVIHRSDRRFIVSQPATLYVEEAPGQTWKAHIRDISQRGMQLVVDRQVAHGTRVRIEWYGRDVRGRIRYQRQTGNEHRLGIELSSSWESLASDVLDRQAEELRAYNAALEEQAEILRRQADLLDLTYDTILVTSIGGIIRSWNHGAEQMYGWTKVEAAGHNVHELLHTAFSTDPMQAVHELLTKGRWEGELVQRRRDGSRIVVASRWALQRTPQGEPAAIMAINSDITAKKAAEEELIAYSAALKMKNEELGIALAAAREASEVKSRFLACVSHELRTPLNGIIGFAELLHDGIVGPVAAEQKECLSDILNCSSHLLALINQVLDLSRVEAGKIDLHVEEVSFDNLVREMIDSVKPIASTNRIDVSFRIDPGMGRVQTDPVRIRQIVFNYLSNALKYSQPGSSVMVEIRRESSATYRIEVEDHGVGIRSEDIRRLFTEFGQLGPATVSQQGTGLGLAITKRIVDALGGTVGVDSEVGKGSRFYAILPLTLDNLG